MREAEKRIYDAVVAAMQPAEELGVLDDDEYDGLMANIEHEARMRRWQQHARLALEKKRKEES